MHTNGTTPAAAASQAKHPSKIKSENFYIYAAHSYKVFDLSLFTDNECQSTAGQNFPSPAPESLVPCAASRDDLRLPKARLSFRDRLANRQTKEDRLSAAGNEWRRSRDGAGPFFYSPNCR